MIWLKIVLSLSLLVILSWCQEDCIQDDCTSNDVALLPATNNTPSYHFYIGGMFGIHSVGLDAYQCSATRTRGVVNVEAFFWAIKKYSASLPVSVGGFVMDSCQRAEKCIENIYNFETCKTKYKNVSPRNTIAFVGPDSSTEVIATAALLKDMNITQVSPIVSVPELSDLVFNYFLRTVPSGAVQTNVMVKFLLHKKIRHVQILYQNNDYGKGLKDSFTAQVNATNGSICITKSTAIGNAVSLLNYLTANLHPSYIVLLATDAQSRFVLQTVAGNSTLNGKFIYLGTPAWGQDSSVIKGLTSAENAITFDFDSGAYSNAGDVTSFWSDFFQMRPSNGNNSNNQYVSNNPWFKEFWETTFGCSTTGPVNTCDLANQNLAQKMSGNDTYIPFTLMAVEAIINGIKNAIQTNCSSNYLCPKLLNSMDGQKGLAMYTSMLEARNSQGQRYFQATGDSAVELEKFRVFQVHNGTYRNVLTFTANSQSTTFGFSSDIYPINLIDTCPIKYCMGCVLVTITTAITVLSTSTRITSTASTTPAINSQAAVDMLTKRFFLKGQKFTGIWKDQPRDDRDKKTRFENGREWIIALGVSLGVGILCVLVFEIYILYKLIGTKIVKQWRTMWLGQLLLFSILLCYLVLIAFLFTPTKATCGITRFGVGVSYAMCFAVLLVKLMVLVTSRTTADRLLPGYVESPNYLRGIHQFFMFFFIVGVQIAIDIQWLIMIPPEAVQVYSNRGDKVWICNHYTWSLDQAHGWSNMTMFVRTEFENHLISLVYVMLLILVTAVVALKTHGIITNHRESVFIGLAAGFSIPVWIIWGLIGGLTKDQKYAQEFGDGAIAFGLLLTASIILFAMFLPNVRQLVNMGVEGIYLEDDKETNYAGSVIMAPPSYKSRPSSLMLVNSDGYSNLVMLGDSNAVRLRHPVSMYSEPVFVKRPESTVPGNGKALRMTDNFTDAVRLRHPVSMYSEPVFVKRPESTVPGNGKALRMTDNFTGKHVNKKAVSEAGYAGSGYGGTQRKSRSENGGTMRRAHSTQDLGAL